MVQFSRSALRTIAVLLPAFTLPVSVAAQTPGELSSRSLQLAVSTFAGYDTDITRTGAGPATAPSASHAGARTTLHYQVRSDKVAFSFRGSADSRYYRADPPLSPTSFSGETLFAADVTSRLNLSASFNTLYSPRFVFSLLPAANDIELNIAPALDYGVTAEKMVSHMGAVNARLQVSRRSYFSASASRGTQRLLDQNYNIITQGYGGGYSYSATRYTTLRLGYKEQLSNYPVIPMGGMRRYTYRTIDAGVNYSRPLSISRRTTLSFSTGSAAVDDTTETYFALTGGATVHHQIRRTWEANVAYARGLSFVAGFSEPFFADAVNANLQGRLARHVTLLVSAGFANGSVGHGALANKYDSVQATTRLEWVVKNERIGVYSNYFYHTYQFDAVPSSITPIPRRVNRNGVSVGLIFRFPLIEERTPRVTR
jgi:hypothetical protein